jgi:CRISPR-associated protein Cas2
MSRTTNRNHFVVAYDIADDDRRAAVFKTLKDFGNHVQYSVFLCELDRRELVTLREILRGIILHTEDQVMFVDVGPATHGVDERMEVLGIPYSPPGRRFVV